MTEATNVWTKAMVVLTLLLSPHNATAEDRVLEFQSGFALSEPSIDDFGISPSVVSQVRYSVKEWVFVSGHLSGELAIDEKDVERVKIAQMLAVGAGAGLSLDLWSRLTFYGAGQVEWLNAWNWPKTSGKRDNVHDGLRLGPTAGLTVWLGRIWGHSLGLEGHFAYLQTRIDGQWFGATRGGLFLSGVLLPDPAL